MLPRAALRPVSLLFVVALTGIEPATLQFSSVQLGLSGCVFGPVQFATKAFVAVRMADVLPWCCPAVGIRLIAGQSNTRRPELQNIPCERNSTSSEYRGNEDADRLHISVVPESRPLLQIFREVIHLPLPATIWRPNSH